ncbi:hypothetical protein, partial [Staphylococcus condimenti]
MLFNTHIKIGNVYHKAYSFTDNDVTYYIEQGREIEFLSTSEGAKIEEIESKFNECSDLAEQQKKRKKKEKRKR